MDYKLIKSRIGTSKVSILSSFSLDGKIIDTSFLEGVGVLFITDKASTIGIISTKGGVNEEWLGKKGDGRVVDGNSNVSRISNAISICTNGRFGFIIEDNGLRVRKFDLKTKDIRTLTGNQYLESIVKYLPSVEKGIKSCANNTSLFFTSESSNRIFKINGNSLDTVVGDGKSRFSVSSDYKKSSFKRPGDIVAVGKKVYIADTGNNCIRSVDFKEKRVMVVSGSPSSAPKAGVISPSKLLINKGMILMLDKEGVQAVNLLGEGRTSVYKSEAIDSIEIDSQRNIYIMEQGGI